MSRCQQQTWKTDNLPTTSIIICFHNEGRAALLRTVIRYCHLREYCFRACILNFLPFMMKIIMWLWWGSTVVYELFNTSLKFLDTTTILFLKLTVAVLCKLQVLQAIIIKANP